MDKDRSNQTYNKEEIKNRRERDYEKRKDKRNKGFQDGSKSDYKRRKQHDSEESKWDF